MKWHGDPSLILSAYSFERVLGIVSARMTKTKSTIYFIGRWLLSLNATKPWPAKVDIIFLVEVTR